MQEIGEIPLTPNNRLGGILSPMGFLGSRRNSSMLKPTHGVINVRNEDGLNILIDDVKANQKKQEVPFSARRHSDATTPQPLMGAISGIELAGILKIERRQIPLASPNTLRQLNRGSQMSPARNKFTPSQQL